MTKKMLLMKRRLISLNFDYDYILAAGLFGATLLAIVIYLIRSKKQKGGKQDD